MAANYFRKHRNQKLHIGCGENLLSGWLNSDLHPRSKEVIYLDAAAPYPFPEGAFDRVFSEHLIEHLPFVGAVHMLHESFRVLRPGGRLRILTPGFESICRLFSEPNRCDVIAYAEWAVRFNRLPKIGNSHCHVANRLISGFGHKFIFDLPTLVAIARNAGFSAIESSEPGMSRDPAFCGIDRHAKLIGDGSNRFETIGIEATKSVPSQAA